MELLCGLNRSCGEPCLSGMEGGTGGTPCLLDTTERVVDLTHLVRDHRLPCMYDGGGLKSRNVRTTCCTYECVSALCLHDLVDVVRMDPRHEATVTEELVALMAIVVPWLVVGPTPFFALP